MTSPNHRKRPAPGASPSHIMQPLDQQFADDHLLRWNSADNPIGFGEGGTQGLAPFASSHSQVPPHFAQTVPATPSNMLARRQMNRALISTNPRASYDGSGDPWSSLVPADPAALDPSASSEMSEQENLQHLEQLALKAKREAESKRKQIPPFVQKLSSFLNEGKNQDLIRWSENGDSFIVVDEEEFAKKLIPELFKHNNYASFVRQLNMYGFHKRVGLSDNSMRASERKNKSPSEYSNPYFRRGHPNLLWLITKPKSNSKAKKAAKSVDLDADSEEDNAPEDAQAYAASASGLSLSEIGSKNKELSLFRDEFKKIREHQQMILQRMQRLEQNQQRIEQQQRAQQQQKDQRVEEIFRLFMRHENSLQSMMQILVYHFKKTLEDNKSAQQIKDMMSTGFLPGAHGSGSHGIVELDDFIQAAQAKSPAPTGVTKRAPRLLEAPPAYGNSSGARTITPSPSTTPAFGAPEMGTVTEIFDTSPGETASPGYNLGSDLDTNSQDNIMKFLQDASTGVGAGGMMPNMEANIPTTMGGAHQSRAQPVSRAPNAAPRVNPNAPSTARMRPPPAPSVSAAVPPVTLSGSTQAQTAPIHPNHPVANPIPSSMASGVNSVPVAAPAADPSHFAELASIPPSIGTLSDNARELEQLKKLQAAQESNIQQLTSRIAPLSPSGQMPPFTAEGSDYFPPALNFDLNDATYEEFIHSDPFSGVNSGSADGHSYDGFDMSLLGLPREDEATGGDHDLAAGSSGAQGAGAAEQGEGDGADRDPKRRKVQ